MIVTRLIQVWPNERGKPDIHKRTLPMSLESVIQALRESVPLPEHVYDELLREGQSTFKDIGTGETTTLHAFEFEANVAGKRDENQKSIDES